MSFVLPVTVPVATTAVVLVQQPGNGDNGGQGEDFGKSSPVGFLLLLIFLIAVAFLVRSMTKHLKRVPKTFDPDEANAETAEDTEDKPEVADAESAKQPEKSESS
jgi:preprotein translocase subunit SecG